jgi:UDP-N-acetylmuramoyl-tripeptide--D-alanyl-D-alanine ligase
MRGEVLRFKEGFTVINDCYNSNPRALDEMVSLLAKTPGYRRRMLVAGEMLELGETSAELHRECGREAARAADWVFGVQGHGREIVEGAVASGLHRSRTRFFENSEEAAAFIPGFVQAGDLLLVKGSRGVKMERIIEALGAKFALPPDSVTATGGGH